MSEQENFIHQMIVSLRTQLLVMGASTEIAVDNMRNAIMKMDAPTAQAVIDGDDAIDLLENQIDSSSLSILARTQPVAGDLRFVVATLRIVVDMERIGDEASTVCGHIILMKGTSASELLDLLQDHLDNGLQAFRKSLRILREGDAEGALEMHQSYDDAEQSEVAIIQKLIERVHNPGSGAPLDTVFVMHMILIVHSITRIWRRSVNIAGHCYFAYRGDSLKHVAPHEHKEITHF